MSSKSLKTIEGIVHVNKGSWVRSLERNMPSYPLLSRASRSVVTLTGDQR